MTIAIILVLTLGILVCAPFLAAKAMGLKVSLGQAAMVGLLSFGLMQVIGMILGNFGPLGGILSFMLGLAAWYQVIRVIHNTDTAKTCVFMFWQVFFLLFLISLVNIIAPADLSYTFYLP